MPRRPHLSEEVCLVCGRPSAQLMRNSSGRSRAPFQDVSTMTFTFGRMSLAPVADRSKGNGSHLMAATAPRSLCAMRLCGPADS